MSEYLDRARERLMEEEKKVSGSGAVGVMKRAVRDALISFCEQDGEFAQAVAQAEGDFGACMAKVAENHGNGISDIEAYRRAVSFYFPGSGVHFEMRIDLCASVSGKDKHKKSAGDGRSKFTESKKDIVVRLEDFF